MKKYLILSTTLFLSACACFGSSDDEQEVQVVKQQRTTYVQQQEPVVVNDSRYENYVSPRQRRVARVYYQDSSNCSNSYASGNSGCQTQVRETREPVEIVYKKTKYTTVYEPKTYTDVSYSREAYTGAPCGRSSSCGGNRATYRRNVVEQNTVFEEDDYIK